MERVAEGAEIKYGRKADTCNTLIRNLHETVSFAVQRVGITTSLNIHVHIAWFEGVVLTIVCVRDTSHFIVAHTNPETSVGNEGDDLLAQLRHRIILVISSILGLEVTTEIELVVSLAWETDDIWSCRCQKRVIRILAGCPIIGVRVLVTVVIRLVVYSGILIIVIPEEGVGDSIIASLIHDSAASCRGWISEAGFRHITRLDIRILT